MNKSRSSNVNIAVIVALALIASALMITVDAGGTVWLKFLLYAALFIALMLPARARCSMFFRAHKKS